MSSTQIIDGAGLFSRDYDEARRRFLAASTERGLTPAACTNPCGEGPAGEPLVLDRLDIGPKAAERVLIIQSATHGVEGFCGSACQLGVLQGGLADRLPPDVKLVLIHALNPHGFAWLRRVNEDNIDLNRNFIDHDAPLPDNPGYEALKDAIAPADLSEATVTEANARLVAYGRTHGQAALQAAITQGQYAYADGLYFGGRQPAWSNQVFCDIVRDACSDAGAVCFLDIHTGLGPHGHGELIMEVPANDPAYIRARTWWGEAVKSTVSGESVSSELHGPIDGAVVGLLPGRTVTSVAVEFGTVAPNTVFKATRADNWLHTRGDPSGPEAPAIKQALRDAFYPDTDVWKRQVWREASQVVDRALVGLAASPS